MACNDVPDDLKSLWKQACADRPVFSPGQLRQGTEKMQARRRKGAVVTAAVMTLFLAAYAIAFLYIPNNTLTRIGSILSVIVCGTWLVHILVERARTASDPGETDSARFYRAELERARHKHRGLAWRLALLAPPFILWDIGFSQIFAKVAWFVAPFIWLDCVLLLAVFTVFGPLKQLKLSRKFQERIDALDGVLRSNGR
jgi:hypothetical protein